LESVVGRLGDTIGPSNVPGRIATGIAGLDGVIEGGFPRGSLVVLGGGPGTGKTEFGAKFLSYGIRTGSETVLYVSLSEDKGQLIADLKHRDPESAKWAKDRRFRFLDLLPTKGDAIGFGTQAVLDEVAKFRVKRLVFDSYSAFSEGFPNDQEARSFLQTVLHKIVRQHGCTTILISEEDKSGQDAKLGAAEYAADAVVWLSTESLEERLLRKMELVKMRGTRLIEKTMLYSLEGGFVVFPPSNLRPARIPGRPAKTTPGPGKYTTGIPDLDEMLEGGLAPSSVVLFSTDNSLSTEERELFTGPAIISSLSEGRPVVVVPPIGEGVATLRPYIGENPKAEWESTFALLVPKDNLLPEAPVPKPVVPLAIDDPERANAAYTVAATAVARRGRQPLLSVVAVDELNSIFGERILARSASQARNGGALQMFMMRPGLPTSHLVELLRSISDFHFKLTKQNGVLLFYGIRPRTNVYAVEFDQTPDRPVPRLRLVD
jgi:KaiC/GvpD/RAD55 family RecA-like ATPase